MVAHAVATVEAIQPSYEFTLNSVAGSVETYYDCGNTDRRETGSFVTARLVLPERDQPAASAPEMMADAKPLATKLIRRQHAAAHRVKDAFRLCREELVAQESSVAASVWYSGKVSVEAEISVECPDGSVHPAEMTQASTFGGNFVGGERINRNMRSQIMNVLKGATYHAKLSRWTAEQNAQDKVQNRLHFWRQVSPRTTDQDTRLDRKCENALDGETMTL